MARVALGLAVLLLGFTPRPVSAQSATLPAPSGRFPIGTTVLHLADSSRRDILKPELPRTITVQLWYPAAQSVPPIRRAPYILETGFVDSLIASQYYGVDTAVLASWRNLRTHAGIDVAPRTGSKVPLIFFSHGLAVARANYTTFAEDLASHGYVVALVDHPYGGEALAPDGRRLSANSDPADLNNVDTLTQRTADWARDLAYILDQLPKVTAPSAQRVVEIVDFHRIGATGHSMGGVAALELCARDARVRACADLDGFPVTPEGRAYTSVIGDGVTKPSLIMRSEPVYSDSELIAKGRTREGWNRGALVTAALWDSVEARSHALFMVGAVRGTGHFNYSDAPFVMPVTITQFGGQIIDGRRGWEVITTTLRAFFEDELNGRGPATFLGLTSQYPEFTVAKVARR